jgi:hypothetical protein
MAQFFKIDRLWFMILGERNTRVAGIEDATHEVIALAVETAIFNTMSKIADKAKFTVAGSAVSRAKSRQILSHADDEGYRVHGVPARIGAGS